MSTSANFVVMGCARSGTGYTSELLTELGYPCGHECRFGPWAKRFEGFGPLNGESSWLAAPLLDQLPEDTVILHQVREPGRAVTSLLSTEFFKEDLRTPVVNRLVVGTKAKARPMQAEAHRRIPDPKEAGLRGVRSPPCARGLRPRRRGEQDH